MASIIERSTLLFRTVRHPILAGLLLVAGALLFTACEEQVLEPDLERVTGSPLFKKKCPSPPCGGGGTPTDAEIVYVGIFKGKRAIMGMAADGSGRSPIWRCPGSCWTPKWSPNGSRIAFMANHDGPANLYAVNADGSGLVRLTEHDGTDGGAEWSPDGNRLVFHRSDAASYSLRPFSLFVVDSDGRGVAPVSG